MDNYIPEITRYGILDTKVTLFNQHVDDIATTAKLTASNTVGITKSKGDVKKELATLAAELTSAAISYATDENDRKLEGTFSINYSDMYYAKDEDTLNLAEMLLDELEGIDPTTRETYLIFEEDMGRLRQLTDKFRGLSKVQGGTHAEVVAAHKKLNILFKNTSSLLRDSLDRLMLRLKRKEPDMVAAYFNVRSQGNVMVETEPISSGVAAQTE